MRLLLHDDSQPCICQLGAPLSAEQHVPAHRQDLASCAVYAQLRALRAGRCAARCSDKQHSLQLTSCAGQGQGVRTCS